MAYGIFINDDGPVMFTKEIIKLRKPIETRSRNVFKQLIGKEVYLISTSKKRSPHVVGWCKIAKVEFKTAAWLNDHRDLTKIPVGTAYDVSDGGKFCYYLENVESFGAYALPADAIRHGRSWCEFNEKEVFCGY